MILLFRRNGVFLLPFVVLILVPGLSAQLPADSHAKVELIAEQNTAPPGRPLWVGLLFRLDPGWHIYWQNPGDSGEPPKIQWQLPLGFTAGTIRWPQPVRLGGGTVVDYGYEGQELLMAPIEGGPKEHATSIPSLSADVKYIVCREMCIPGKAHLTLASPPAAIGADGVLFLSKPGNSFPSQFRLIGRYQWKQTSPTSWFQFEPLRKCNVQGSFRWNRVRLRIPVRRILHPIELDFA